MQSFGRSAIYGWEFIDVHQKVLKRIGRRTSFDIELGADGRSHTITPFQDTGQRILDLIIWFDQIQIHTPAYERIALQQFIEGGRRWWDAMFADDELISNVGIFRASLRLFPKAALPVLSLEGPQLQVGSEPGAAKLGLSMFGFNSER